MVVRVMMVTSLCLAVIIIVSGVAYLRMEASISELRDQLGRETSGLSGRIDKLEQEAPVEAPKPIEPAKRKPRPPVGWTERRAMLEARARDEEMVTN